MKQHPFAFGAVDSDVRAYQQKYVGYFRPGEHVLELACGYGVFLEVLRERDVKGTGVDIFGEALDVCRHKGLSVEKAEVTRFVATTEERFDGIFCAHLIEHLPGDTIPEFVMNCYRILRPGGRLILITPNSQNIQVITETFWLDLTHERLLPRILLESLLKDAGFRVLASGDDPDTRRVLRGGSISMRLKYWLARLRFGKMYTAGDTFVVGVKD